MYRFATGACIAPRNRHDGPTPPILMVPGGPELARLGFTFMKKIRSEADTTEGFTIRMLMSMGPALAEALSALQTAVVQYDALASVHGLPACPNPLDE